MKAIAEVSVDTRILADKLRELKASDTVSYTELSKAVGRDVRTRAKSALYSARNIVLREGIVTECVMRVGIKRLTDSEIVGTAGQRARAHIRRVSKRAARKLTAVEFGGLTDPQKAHHNAELSVLGALAAFATDHTAKRIESKVDGQKSQPLAIANTLKAFSE